MRSELILAIFLLWSTSAWAGTQYYLDPTCTYDGNGLASTCAATIGASGARNAGFTLTGTGADLSIKAGTTLTNSRIYITATGTSGDHVVITKYGEGANPILDWRLTQSSGSWSLVSGSVYKATNTATQQIRVLTVDDVRLKSVYWVSTDSEATNVARMTAGSHMTDTSGQKVYVWTSDGTSPAGHTVKYSPSQGDVYYGIMDTRYQDVSYVDVSYLTFKGGQNFNLFLGLGTGSCTDCSVSYVTSQWSGGNGILVSGNRPTVSYNTCSYNSSEKDEADPSLVDSACIVVQTSTGESNIGGTVSYNTVSHPAFGSCYEINGNGINSSLDGTHFHHNTGTQCRSGIELYGCYSASGTCNGPINSIIEDNFLSYTGHTPLGGGYGYCGGSGNGSSYNIFRNNICIDFPTIGFGSHAGRIASETGHHNKFYNNTFYISGAVGTFQGVLASSGSAGHLGGNEFKNNIIIMGLSLIHI